MGRFGKQNFLWGLLAALLLSIGSASAQPGGAVVVVGPVDPPANQRTRAYIAEAENVAQILEQAGYSVERLYHPQATWKKVRRASQGAQLFVYYGHGNGYGWLGHTDDYSTNGLCLTNPRDFDLVQAGPGIPGGNGEDLAELNLAPGATVLLVHSCYATGSSKYDSNAVGRQTATQRVADYAQAFFQAGASHYVATAYVDAAPDYLEQWLGGESARQTFIEVLGTERIYSGDGMLLVEDSHGPNDPHPWVSAMVSNSATAALATSALEQPSPQQWQPRAEEQYRAGLGDRRMVVVVPAAEEGDDGQRPEWQAPAFGDENWLRYGEWQVDWYLPGKSILNRGLSWRDEGLGSGDFRLQQWWGLDDLFALDWRKFCNQWVATGVL